MIKIMNTSHLVPEEQEAFNILSNTGLEVEVVPTGKNKSPEFIINGDECGYAVEVKARHDSEEWGKSLLKKGEAFITRSTSFGRWACDVSRDAIKQLNAVDPKHERWWVLWFSIECNAATESMFQQAIGTLLGVRQLLELDSGKMWDCIYAQPGVFERFSEIVAVVVTDGEKITLCVNELANNYNTFTHSIIYNTFNKLRPPVHATELSNNRNFFLVDPKKVDRKDDTALSNYLGRKYNLKRTIFLDMKEHTASVLSPFSR